MYWLDWLDRTIFGLLSLMSVLLVFLMILGVRSAVVEKDCLEAGYPNYTVTYDFEGYCMNLEGDVTVKVEKQ